MQCLNCGAAMVLNQVSTANDVLAYDMCERCGSLWLDRGELDKLAFQVQGSIEYCSEDADAVIPGPEARVYDCPRCDRSRLERVRFLGETDIVLHHCPHCGGFWLDGGELNLIDSELAKSMPVSGRGFSDFVNNVHVPYWFKRVKTPGGDHRRIEAMPIPGARREGSTSDPCPACGQPLAEYSVFSMHIEGCPVCKGVWLAPQELRALKNRINPSARWLNDEIDALGKSAALPARRICPRCRLSLVSAILGRSGLMLDWCPQCRGVWFDGGEFHHMTDYLQREMFAMHAGAIGKQALEEIKRLLAGPATGDDDGGSESRGQDLLDARAAIAAMLHAAVLDHPGFANLCTKVPRL